MKRVLFVDDQKDILDLLKVKLTNRSYEALFADSCDSALKILEGRDIHVVVTDLLMPGENGIVLLQELKQRYPGVVRIVLSGLSQVSFILSAINNGDIYRYITKPWKIDDEAEQIIQSALEYSDFLRSREECVESFTSSDIESILEATGCRAALLDEGGKIVFGPEGDGGRSISLSNGWTLKMPLPETGTQQSPRRRE